jgi:phosphoribosylamine--glycine ligase
MEKKSMQEFDQLSNLNCIYQGSVKDIYQDDRNSLYFKFSDRYSIYDWGEMPDHIPNKGKSLAAMSTSFFELLDQLHIPHHFLGSEANGDYIKVKKVNVLKPTKVDNKYDYEAYQTRPTNTLVPLEIIFRNGLPEGSSFFKRANDTHYLKTLGIDKLPEKNDFFKEPVIEFSTKLEPMDRYLSYTEAKYIAGLTDQEFENLIHLTRDLSRKLSKVFEQMGLELWDGKFEFAFHLDHNGIRDFQLVDSIGLDELRVLKNGVHLSKELIRQYYQGTKWMNQLSSYKGRFGDEWKKNMILDGITPKHLDKSFLEITSELYTSFSSDLKNVITGHPPTELDKWFKKVKSYFGAEKKNILLIGNGGREHALAWKLLQSKNTNKVFITGSHHAMLEEDNIYPLEVQTTKDERFIEHLHKENIKFIVIGPEAPLVEGMADFLRQNGFVVFGPGQLGAKLEESKNFSKNIMLKAGIPTAEYQMFTDPNIAKDFVNNKDWTDGYVIKADGLAAGKGVIVTSNKKEAFVAIEEIMVQNSLGLDDTTIIIEERLIGKEVSVFALIDQNTFKTIGNACDYKRIRDNDEGPNTGGMGTYSPCEWLTADDMSFIDENVFKKLVNQLKEENIEYNGVIFAGLMKTKSGLKVLEFNVRFGDPETQSLLPRIKNDFEELLYKTATNQLHTVNEINLSNETVVNVVCAAFGYPGTEGTPVRKDDAITLNLENIQNGKVFFAGVKIDNGSLLTSGGRVLGVTGQGKNKDEARASAYQNLKQINFEGMQYRNDIAK